MPISGTALPERCDPYLAPPGDGEFFASRLWYDTVIAHALPPGVRPLLAEAGKVLLPLLRRDGRLESLATPYSLTWQPLISADAEPAAVQAAGRALGRLFRHRAPVRLDTLPAEAPGLAPLRAGFADAGLRVLAYNHFGNWHAALPPGTGWDAYLATRPPALRTTIGRKLARARRELRFEAVAAPGVELETGIAAYVAVRAASWKPHEPFPDFDGQLMRAAAAAGLLRLGILRAATDGQPVAAQYWVLDRGGRRATVLKLAHAEKARAGSPGTALTAMMIRRLLEDDKVTELDFGRGDDDYKRLWVGERRQRIGLLLACPLHPVGLLALARHAAGRLADHIAGRLRGTATA